MTRFNAPRSGADPKIPGLAARTFEEKGQTQQQFKDACDINRIIARLHQGAEITHINTRQPIYGHATGQSFTEAMFAVKDAENEFLTLPAKVRAHFKNDPSDYLDALSDESRLSEFEELGLTLVEVPPENEIPSEATTEALIAASEAEAD